MEDQGVINKDINAVKNMKKITESLLKNKTRPVNYSRKKSKSTNPPLKRVSNSRQCIQGDVKK